MVASRCSDELTRPTSPGLRSETRFTLAAGGIYEATRRIPRNLAVVGAALHNRWHSKKEVAMTVVTPRSIEDLRSERRHAIESTGLDEATLRTLAAEWALSTSEADALSRVEQIDFLLGEAG